MKMYNCNFAGSFVVIYTNATVLLSTYLLYGDRNEILLAAYSIIVHTVVQSTLL
jgi:hypothetical protein